MGRWDQSFWGVLALPAGMALAAIVVFLRARRGRRIGDHPHCRQCGFDLFGTPSNRCGECGSDLSDRRAVVIGARQRRPVAMASAALLVLLAVMWGANSARTAGWFNQKPAWLLRFELGIDARRPAALAELQRRITGGRWELDSQRAWRWALAEPAVRRLMSVAGNPADFDDRCGDFLLSVWYYLDPEARRDAAAALVPILDAQEPTVAARAARVFLDLDLLRGTGDIHDQLRRAAEVLIERHANRSQSWEGELGELVAMARRRSAVNDAAWSRFARQIVDPQLRVRSRIRAGDELPFDLDWGIRRDGSHRLTVRGYWEYCRIDAIQLMLDSMDPPDAPGDVRNLPVGWHLWRAAVTIRVAEVDPVTTEQDAVVAQWHQEAELPVEVVPADQDVVRRVAAPGLPEAFARTARISAHQKRGTLWITGEVGPLPATVAARAVVEDPATSRRWDAGEALIRGNARQLVLVTLPSPWEQSGTDPPAAGAVVNLLLEPDPRAARETIDVTEYADVPLRIDGLVIRWQQ